MRSSRRAGLRGFKALNWQHLDLNFGAVGLGCTDGPICEGDVPTKFGKKVSNSYRGLYMFMLGGVIFF